MALGVSYQQAAGPHIPLSACPKVLTPTPTPPTVPPQQVDCVETVREAQTHLGFATVLDAK